ncbi:hypothetical protein LTR70_000494 [Exophiala xenobiotica]|uniref:RING-type domain-containing protein n=1 Tax=Lithohypha guttulata TaxID=1690604 RepID=A0ABR0KBI1_9EURO|nr:hypothetical protein LTR24_004699 [Lithohypha guttulata]KAK5329345.1 hypothetical protein LTR70_000494 [Exophiala xenobiotica]
MATSENSATAIDNFNPGPTIMDNTANVEHLPGAILESQAGPERRVLINTEQTVDPETSPVPGPEAQNRPSTPPQGNLENPHPCLTDLYITYGASSRNNEMECPICQEDIASTDETLTHETCRLSFCRACFETWLEGGNAACPNCRVPLPAKDDESRGPRNYPDYYSDEEFDSENESDTEAESGSYWESDWDSDASGSSSGWETDSDSDDDETDSGEVVGG